MRAWLDEQSSTAPETAMGDTEVWTHGVEGLPGPADTHAKPPDVATFMAAFVAVRSGLDRYAQE